MDWKKLKEEATRFGWLRITYRVAMDRVSPFFQVHTIHIRPLEPNPDNTSSKAAIRVATRAELHAAAERMPDILSRSFIDSALAQDGLCIAAFVEDEIVSFVWRSYTSAPYLGNIRVGFDPLYRYGYKSYTQPEFRGQHLLALNSGDPICIERGCQFALAYIATHNYASIRMNLRNGNKIVGYAGHLTLFGKTFCFCSPGAKKHSFRFYVVQ